MRRIAGLVAVVVLAACGGGGEQSSRATVPNEPAAAASPAPNAATAANSMTDVGAVGTVDDVETDVEAAVEQAYYAYWDALVAILRAKDVTNPLIGEHLTGSARERLLDTISNDIADGLATRLPDDPDHWQALPPRIELEGGTAATVISCHVDGLVLYVEDTGEILNDRVVTVQRENEFVLEDGRWKLARATIMQSFEGVGGCAADSQ